MDYRELLKKYELLIKYVRCVIGYEGESYLFLFDGDERRELEALLSEEPKYAEPDL